LYSNQSVLQNVGIHFYHSVVNQQKLLVYVIVIFCYLRLILWFSCHFQVKCGMEVFFHLEVESRFLSECTWDGANGCAALWPLPCNTLHAGLEEQNPRTAEGCTQLGLYSYIVCIIKRMLYCIVLLLQHSVNALHRSKKMAMSLPMIKPNCDELVHFSIQHK